MAPPNEIQESVSNSIPIDTVKQSFHLSEGNLRVNGVTLLSDVPNNVTLGKFSLPPDSDAPLPLLRLVQARSHNGGFLGFTQDNPSDRLINSLGKFNGTSFVSVFRFKTWWSTMWIGDSGSHLEKETQWVLLDVSELSTYVLILPLIEGSFRSALNPGKDGHVMIIAESGSTQVKTSSFSSIAYIHVCDNPYDLMKDAFSAARVHLNTFRLLEEKSLPSLVDKFGWCTWDAFYLTVDPIGVWHGVKEFTDGGFPLRFLIIDDGWQSINLDGENPAEDAKNLVLGGEQMTARLHRFQECDKFNKYKSGTMLGPTAPSFDINRPKMITLKAIELEHAQKARDRAVQSGVTELSSFDSTIANLKQELNQMIASGQDSSSVLGEPSSSSEIDQETGLKAFTKDLRTKFTELDDIYVWHALCGAWGGVRPGATHLDSKVVPVSLSPGLDGTMDDLAVVRIVEGGIGLVHPSQADDLYESMHSYLAECGITGVKVDVIHTLEYVCEEYGGRVELAKAYYQGISKSIAKNFKGTGFISSMEQCNDFFFLGTKQIPMGRVGDDFWVQDPNGDPMGLYWLQGLHTIHCAFNSLWMGQIIQPDWDMFQSDHPCAKYHAASRAICGGPIYVSDSLGGHDFDLIRKLVFPDGTIPRCLHFALPTRDSLFKNPNFDGQTIFKMWNLNKFGGVIGAFNCQGAGWDQEKQTFRGHSQCYKPVSGSIHIRDIEWDQKEETADMGSSEEYAVYMNQTEKLLLMSTKSDSIDITVQPSSFEILTFVPIKKLRGHGIKFAPIGLSNMFNSGGTIQEVEYDDIEETASVRMKVKGVGKFLAYSSVKPRKICLNGGEVGFEWWGDGKLTIDVPWNEDEAGICLIDLSF
ncbi:stachyose synthase [Aristolochia californica]|uniref:stachyose synthase n=1 Tax=Aristolochia californica TaxID=171875 RepID=UPI0035E0E35A